MCASCPVGLLCLCPWSKPGAGAPGQEDWELWAWRAHLFLPFGEKVQVSVEPSVGPSPCRNLGSLGASMGCHVWKGPVPLLMHPLAHVFCAGPQGGSWVPASVNAEMHPSWISVQETRR